MALFSSIKNKVSSAATTLKNTFLPSEKVSAERREAVFGTTNKAVVGGIIIGGAAAAIAAGPTGIVTGAKAVVNKLTTSFKASSLVTQAAIVGGGIVAGSAILANPSIAKPSNVTKTLTGLGADIGEFSRDPTLENAYDVIKDNPVAATVIAGVGALLLGKTLIAPAASVANTLALKEQTEAINEKVLTTDNQDTITDTKLPKDDTGLPKTPAVSDKVSLIPITPETQVLGKSATSLSKSKRRKQTKQYIPNLRINIYNQTKHLNNRYVCV